MDHGRIGGLTRETYVGVRFRWTQGNVETFVLKPEEWRNGKTYGGRRRLGRSVVKTEKERSVRGL